ncbi:MAG TPA: nucleotidyltransferase family protein [Noviherbaspirillum sp.]|nr:nucleotidyltransferase family protein [Noviherbaspirillum sp.]
MLQAISPERPLRSITGLLLAAGRGTRFDPTGKHNKLLQPLPNGNAVALAAAKNLLASLPSVLAIVRPGADSLALQLHALGCEIAVCPSADEGMAASLVHGLTCASDAGGWVIALADMPYIQPTTIRMLANALADGAPIAVPTYQGRRGHPVAFGRAHLPELMQLRGDQGARRLLKAFPVIEIATDDPGIVQDIDRAEDLQQGCLMRS